MKNILLIIFVLLVTACQNSLNLRTAHDYFQGGLQSAKEGKWYNARMSFGRAWANANLGNAKDNVIAVYAYEYGRASGAICDWDESEKGLLKALELDKKINGPTHMSLIELARMYNAQGSLSQSEKYYFLGKKRLDELQADTKDTIGYANILKSYSAVLNKLGRKEEANALTKREQEIRSVFKYRRSSHGVTPYGMYCDQKSLTKISTRTIYSMQLTRRIE